MWTASRRVETDLWIFASGTGVKLPRFALERFVWMPLQFLELFLGKSSIFSRAARFIERPFVLVSREILRFVSETEIKTRNVFTSYAR